VNKHVARDGEVKQLANCFTDVAISQCLCVYMVGKLSMVHLNTWQPTKYYDQNAVCTLTEHYQHCILLEVERILFVK